MEKIKRGETPIVPLRQSEDMQKYRERTDKQDGYYGLYQEFWNKRRETEGAWAKNEPYDLHWPHINPDDLTNEDFFYYMLWKSERVSGEEAKKMMQEEYWPRVQKYLDNTAAEKKKRAQRMGEPFDAQKFCEGDSRYNFFHWLLRMIEAPISAVSGQHR